jgi:hypothetical protein
MRTATKTSGAARAKSRRIRALVVASLIIPGQSKLGVHAQWVNSPAWTAFVPATAVSFAISTDKNSYSVQEHITLKYQIVNISNHALYVPRAWAEGCPTVTLHVASWFEDGIGRRSGSGIGSSCGITPGTLAPTVSERMNKEAVLLMPGEHVDGTAPLVIPTGREGFPPGAYRIEAILSGWNYDRFTDAERLELATIGNPFLRGEIPASVRVTLTP